MVSFGTTRQVGKQREQVGVKTVPNKPPIKTLLQVHDRRNPIRHTYAQKINHTLPSKEEIPHRMSLLPSRAPVLASASRTARAAATARRKLSTSAISTEGSNHGRFFQSVFTTRETTKRTARRNVSIGFKQFSSSSDQVQDPTNVVHIHHLSNGIRHVELNRPDKLNALNLKMFHEIAKAAKEIRQDPSARAVIVSGKGRAFCTGLDVKSILKPSTEDGILPTDKIKTLLKRPSGYERQEGEARAHYVGEDEEEESVAHAMIQDLYQTAALGNLAQDVAMLWRNIPIPVIAVLQGMCFGGGLQIALGADMRYATQDCKLSIMESKWGLIPDMGATITLRELVRIDVAKELTFTGKVVDGTEAEKLGLITRVCEDPMQEAMMVAKDIASKSPDSTAAAKVLYQKSWFASDKDCLELETEIQEKLLVSWNQLAASAKNFGVNVPYKDKQDFGT